MPAKNDDAVFQEDRGEAFAGKPRSYRDRRTTHRGMFAEAKKPCCQHWTCCASEITLGALSSNS